MEVAGVVVQEVKSIEQLILNYVDMLRWSHPYHLYFYFLSSLCQGHDGDELPPLIVAGCPAKVLFARQRYLTCARLGCAA